MCLREAEAGRLKKVAVVSCPVASFRARANPRSELVTQEVFGRQVSLHLVKADWALCSPLGRADASKGWVPLRYLALEAVYHPGHIVVRRFGVLRGEDGSRLLLPMGSLIEARGVAGTALKVKLPGGGSGSIGRTGLGRRASRMFLPENLPAIAREVIGTPYLWGGKSTFGFDCSGLVQFVFELIGIRLPRNSCEQAGSGRLVSRGSSLRPLDLVFFGQGAIVDHVAIHVGGLSILHASGFVKVESLDPASSTFRADLEGRIKLVRRLVR